MSEHHQTLREAAKLGALCFTDGAGESRRKASIMNDALSVARVYWAFKAYPTQHADRVAIQFRAEGAEQVVEVDAVRFLAFLKNHPRHHEIREALGRKLEAERAKNPPTNTH